MSRPYAFVAILLIGGVAFAVRESAVFAQPAESVIPEVGEDESLLLNEPTTAAEAYDAAILMLDLGQPQLTRRYLKATLDFIGTDDDILLALREDKGAAVFLRLARNPNLQPFATQMLERSNEALARRQQDPRYLDRITDGLAGTPEQRATAIVTLRGIGPSVVPRMLQRIDSEQGSISREVLVFSFSRMGDQVVPPLIGALDAPDDAVRQVAIESLGWLGSLSALPHLWYPAFAPDQAPSIRDAARQAIARIERGRDGRAEDASSFGVAERLKELALANFTGRAEWKTDDEGQTSLWTWVPGTDSVGRVRMPVRSASMFRGLQFARDLLAIAPTDEQAQALVTASALGWDSLQVGWDRPLPVGPGTAHDLALSSGAESLQDAAELALGSGNTIAALATLQTLSEVAGREVLISDAGSRNPILAALDYPDSRVQFVAATSILDLDPRTSFPGSSRVVEILVRALTDKGRPGLVVMDPNPTRGIEMAGFLSGLGFDDRAVRTGKQGFRMAADRGDIELIAMHVNVIDWELTPTIVNLRADARTAAIPIIIYGPESTADDVHRISARYPLVHFIIEGGRPAFVQDQARPFVSGLVTPPLTPAQRADRSAAAVYWLGYIAQGQRARIFDLRKAEAALFAALNDSKLALDALRTLSAIPTATTQTRLAEVATNPRFDPELRATAAGRLGMHIRQYSLLIDERMIHGIRLTRQTTTQPELHAALSAVIGTLQPNRQLAAERLMQVAPPRPRTEPRTN